MTWREWAHWLYAYEFNQAREADNIRRLYTLLANVNKGRNKAAMKPETIWPIPILDQGKQVKHEDSKEHEKLRELYSKYLEKNGTK